MRRLHAGPSCAERIDRAIEVAPGDARAATVERVRVRHLGNDPVDPVEEPELPEHRGGERRRMHRRAHVVPEPRQRQLGRAHPAADGRRALEHAHSEPGARGEYRGDEPVGPAPDDRDVDRHAIRIRPRGC